MNGGDKNKQSPGGERRRRLPQLKIPRGFRKNLKPQQHTAEEELDLEEELQQLQGQQEQLQDLVETSRRLIRREEQLFSLDSGEEGEGNKDQLQRDLEALKLHILMAIHKTFTSSSSGDLQLLQSAVVTIQDQGAQDLRWYGCPDDGVPVWRPLECLSTHNIMLGKVVESRLMIAAEDESSSADGLSSPLKRQVCRVGKRVKDDLLTVVRTVKDCYPPEMDILNVYAGLYQHNFSTRLTEVASTELDADECSYLLFWVNHYYPQEILQHEELKGEIDTARLGSLLREETLNQLEHQYLTHREDKVKLWLQTALKKEEESWLSDKKPELMDSYYFSPLAIDVIQVFNCSLTECKCVIGDQSKVQRITAHLDNFLTSYKRSVEDFVKGRRGDIPSLVKAHLVCEEQFRDYITSQTGSLSEQLRRCCLDTLAALKDCGYRCLIGPIHSQLKLYYTQLWTSGWLDGSLPAVDSLLGSLNEQLPDLTDLKPSCRQSVLSSLHQDVVVKYVEMMLKAKMKSREQEVGGAQRMVEDAQKINSFFSEGGSSESSWLGEMLCSIADLLRLQDPVTVQLEMAVLASKFPDLSDAHVSALLSLKTGLSAADVRSVRCSVKENRPLQVSPNHSPPFFSRVKVKWISRKMRLKT
ncbi:tumor necrosis factor alpha-induced protein 2a [Aulostomus maculatus]